MKLLIILFILLSSICSAQDLRNSALINLESEGVIVNLQSVNFTNNLYNFPIEVENRVTDIDIGLNITAWKFSKEFNFGGFGEINGSYHYTDYVTGYAKFRRFSGSLFGEADRYLNDELYATFSGGTFFINSTIESSQNVLTFSNTDKGSINYLWGGIGMGRLLNRVSKTKEENFEKILIEEGLINESLPISVKASLNRLLEKRNNKDFISEFRDDSDVEFFREVENVLLEEGIIRNGLNSAATIKLYNALINKRYLYYPDYKGFQIQAELQAQLNDNSFNHFLTFGGILGLPFFKNSNLLLTSFFSIPLNEHANAEGLFNQFKNPFTNYLPVIVEKYKIDNKNYTSNRESIVDLSKDQIFFAGLKGILFYKINEFSGIRGFASTILNKPLDSSVVNFSTMGVILELQYFFQTYI